MAVPSIVSGGGFRRATLFPLKTTNSLVAPPAVAGADPYEGIQLVGAKTLTLTIPEPQILTHTGDDGVLGSIMLPPNESVAGELRTGATNLTADATLQGINEVTIGDMKTLGRGIVPQVYIPHGVLAYRQAVVTDPESATKGADCWVWAMMPISKLAPRPSSFEEGGVDENIYNILPHTVTRYLWGTQFVSGTEGFESAQIIYGISNGPPKFESFLIDTTPTLTLNYGQTARFSENGTDTATKVWLWDTATGGITDITATSTLTNQSTFTVVGAVQDDMIYIMYETEAVF